MKMYHCIQKSEIKPNVSVFQNKDPHNSSLLLTNKNGIRRKISIIVKILKWASSLQRGVYNFKQQSIFHCVCVEIDMNQVHASKIEESLTLYTDISSAENPKYVWELVSSEFALIFQ